VRCPGLSSDRACSISKHTGDWEDRPSDQITFDLLIQVTTFDPGDKIASLTRPRAYGFELSKKVENSKGDSGF
jgi:hypothetical protein